MLRIISAVPFQPFFIGLNSQNTNGEVDLNPENEELVIDMNSNVLYYYFCVDVKDFLFQKLDTKSHTAYACVAKYICIKSYYPSFEFYEKVLKEIFDYVMNSRLLLSRSEKTVTDATLNNLTNLKFDFEDARIEKMGSKLSQMLMGLHRLEIGQNLPKSLMLPPNNMTISLRVSSFSHPLLELFERLRVAH